MLLNEQLVVIFAKPKISPLWSISLRFLAGKWRQRIPEFAENASKFRAGQARVRKNRN